MSTPVRTLKPVLTLVCLSLLSGGAPASARQATSDLDQFMAVVLKRRDDNWRKLQQYILDERETADFFAPGKVRLFGMDHQYSWFIRDGVFVRSPVKFDGVTLSESDRRKAEDEWIAQEKQHDKDAAAQAAAARQGAPAPAPSSGASASSIDAILKSTREPQFVSSSYFLRFKFEPGHYALVGPETFDGHQVLRIEYYPRHLYDDDGPGHDGDMEKAKEAKEAKGGKGGKEGKESEEDIDQRINRQMNKTALVTLWVEPNEHQIVQYRFENLPLDFLPGRSLVRVDGFGATMKMGQPFPGVWLPQDIDATGTFTLALGTFDAGYAVRYRNFREANVGMKVHTQ
jgi:hypothetical protein